MELGQPGGCSRVEEFHEQGVESLGVPIPLGQSGKMRMISKVTSCLFGHHQSLQ